MAIFELLLGFARRPDLRPVAERWLNAYEELAEQALIGLQVPDPGGMAKTLIATVHGLMLRQLFVPVENPELVLFGPTLRALLAVDQADS